MVFQQEISKQFKSQKDAKIVDYWNINYVQDIFWGGRNPVKDKKEKPFWTGNITFGVILF